jgi:hypothetical protein
MNIKDILLIITIIYLVISYCKRKKIENFALSSDDKNEVRVLIKEIYNTDMDAIRTLAKMADDIQRNGLEVKGNLIVTGTIKSTGDISSASYSLSGLNTSITATNTALGTTNTNLTATNTALTTADTNLTTTLKDYVKYKDNIRITNRGTGQPETDEPYIGVSGRASTGKIDVSMNTDISVTTFRIVKP